MDKMDEFTNEFEEMGEKEKQKAKMSSLAKIIIIILSFIILSLSVVIVLIFVLKKDDDDDEKKEKKEDNIDDSETYTNFFRKAFSGEIYYNLTYATEKVENTFKLNGDNYREEIGLVNENEDYVANKDNIYDLYIPYSAIKTKKTKGIILFIHGGAWIYGSKEDMSFIYQIYFEHEYIIAI